VATDTQVIPDRTAIDNERIVCRTLRPGSRCPTRSNVCVLPKRTLSELNTLVFKALDTEEQVTAIADLRTESATDSVIE
jgi:hypothetical protein